MLGLPKGSLEESTKTLFAKAGWKITTSSRSYRPAIDDPELDGRFVRAQEVSRYVEHGYFESRGVKVELEFSWGATEVKVPDLVDAIVDITETGSSLRAAKLRIVDTLLETNTKFIANKASWAHPAKRRKIETIALLLRGALEAGSKVGLKMNLPRAALERVSAQLPALRNPTIAQLSAPDWIALETIIDESVVREIIPQLKALGAEGIVEYPLNKVVY